MSRWFYHRCPRQSELPQYIQHQAHIRDLNHISKLSFSMSSKSIFWSLAVYSPHPASNDLHLYFIAYSNCSAVKPFEPVQYFLKMFFCFMPVVIMSKTSHHLCVLNSATLRNKGELHLLSNQIFNYCCTDKYSSTITYLRSLVTLYTFYKKQNRHYFMILFSCYIV